MYNRGLADAWGVRFVPRLALHGSQVATTTAIVLGRMGIKFKCPAGHSLNVKAELAGKRGVCPKCGAKFRIPLESVENDRAVSPAADATNGPAASQPATPVAAGTTPLPATAASVGPAASVPATSVPAGSHSVSEAPASAVSGHVGQPAVATAIPAAVAMPVHSHPAPLTAVPATGPLPAAGGTYGAVDPIAEAPMAAWYVRPPSGGQFGPARGDIMQKWIAEGRVTGTSYVWREGWADWRGAAEVFPSLAGAVSVSSTAGEIVAPAATARASRTAGRYQTGRKKSNALGVFMLIFLGLLCIVMVGVLVLVLGNLK